MKRTLSIFLFLAAQAAQAGGSNMQANGTFDITLTPQTSPDSPPWGRQRMEKVFHGDIEGSGIGEMLALRTDVKGSAGYVAMERISATLDGRTGTFFIQHSGLMDKGSASLNASVVPDSATGQLKGLKGSMTIRIEAGVHYYGFSYTLP